MNSIYSTSCFVVKSVLFQDTGRELLPTDIKYYQMFGGEKVTKGSIIRFHDKIILFLFSSKESGCS